MATSPGASFHLAFIAATWRSTAAVRVTAGKVLLPERTRMGMQVALTGFKALHRTHMTCLIERDGHEPYTINTFGPFSS